MQQARCEVCNSPLFQSDLNYCANLGYSVCHAHDCRHFMQQKAKLPYQLFQIQLEIQQEIHRERRRAIEEREQLIQQLLESELKENNALLEAALKKHNLNEEQVRTIVIPSGGNNLEKPDEKRIAHYKEHIRTVIDEAENYISASEVPEDHNHSARISLLENTQKFAQNSHLKATSDKLCEKCKGACCSAGKDHGFISALSVRRVLDENPELNGNDLYEMYVDKIPSSSIKDSCINHSENGCALSRELRSDVCNAHYCDPLLEFHQDELNCSPKSIFAIQREYTFRGTINPDESNEVIDTMLIYAKPS